MKPLGHKAYGSIPHLPGSRTGPMDYTCHEGQARILCEKARDKYDRIIVTEKLDGSNVAVANIGGQIVAITRAGYLAETSPFQMHHDFARWVTARSWQIPVGFRLSGEWMTQAHGTIYQGHDPLICFDVFDGVNKRLPHDEARIIMDTNDIPGAHVLSDGPPASISSIISALGNGFHGAQEAAEGAVWRVERKGAFDFMAKFVRSEKIDGKYLPSQTGGEPVIMIEV